MRFVIIGINGKMGQEVKKSIQESKDTLVAGVDIKEDFSNNVYSNLKDIPNQFDAVIDFSLAQDRQKYITFCKENKILYGCFATNLSKQDVKHLNELSKVVPVLMCNNASVGVNLMFKVADLLAENANHADFVLTEYHHKEKLDSPSGTARTLVSILNNKGASCSTISNRVGTEKGRHVLEVFWEDESLTIVHQANNRKIFAIGAIKLMNKLATQEKGLYSSLSLK